MKLDLKTISVAVGLLITVVSSTYGGYVWLTSNFTPTSKHQVLEGRVDIISIQRALEKLYSEYYFLQGELRKDPANVEIQKKFDLLKKRIERLEARLAELEKRLDIQ